MSDAIDIPSETRIKAQLSRAFRLAQLTARPDASTYAYNHIMDHLAMLFDQGKIVGNNTMHFVDQQINLIVDTVLQVTKDQKNVQFVEINLIKQVVSIITTYTNVTNTATAAENNDIETVVSTVDVDQAIKYATLQQTQPIFIFDPFNLPKFTFSLHQNQYLPDSLRLFKNPGSTSQRPLRQLGNNKSLHSDPASFGKMFNERYFSIYQRVLRQEKYANQQRNLIPSSSKSQIKQTNALSAANSTNIYQVDSLRGTNGELTVFGFISEIIGQIYLESPSSRVLLDISNAILVDTDALIDPDDPSSSTTLYTTYTSNTQLSQVIQQYGSSQMTPHKNQQNNQHQTHPNTLTPTKAHQIKSPSRMKSVSLSTNDLQDKTIINHNSIFAKLFNIGTFVLISGQMQDNILIAKRCQLPKHETREQTLSLYPALRVVHPYTDYIANPIQHYTYLQGKPLQQQLEKLQQIQSAIENVSNASIVDINSNIKNQNILMEALEDPRQGHLLDKIIILGEIYLHDPLTISKLHMMFNFLENDPPKYIIMTGNFMSAQFYTQNRYNPQIIASLFDKLADVVFSYKQLRTQTHFVLTAGTFDYIYGNTIPIPPLPPPMVARLVRVITNVTFTSNLVNIRYYGRDIKIFRHDLYQTIYNRNNDHFAMSKLIEDSMLPQDMQILKQNRKKRTKMRAQRESNEHNNEKNAQNISQLESELGGIGPLAHNKGNKDIKQHHNAFADEEFQFKNFNFDENDHKNGQNDPNGGFSDTNDPDDDMEQTRFIGDIVVKHLTSQDTLIPDIHLKPTCWDYAQAYSLTSLPDAMFLVDTQQPYNVTKFGTIFYNTGPFTGTWSFVQYFPSTNTVHPIILP